MKSSLQTLLFDFDHTLADPSAGVEACCNFALAGLGLPAAPPAEIRRTVGLSLADTFLRLAGPDHGDRSAEFSRLFVARAEAVMVENTRLYPAAVTAVSALWRRGLALGIVSMKYRRHIEPVLARAGLLPAFGVVIGGEDVGRPKPNPEGVALALAALNGSPATAAYVGDGLSDAETARRAGLPFLAVLTGGLTPAGLAGYEVWDILADVGELPEWLERGGVKRKRFTF